MGVCCGDGGKLTITDDGIIKKSNLRRWFLFHDCNIGQAKSTVAALAAFLINLNLHVEALQNRASPQTEIIFDDTFWENLTVVINALDDVGGRLYIDEQCVYFQKPLLESGTVGATCNTQMVIHHLTENYDALRGTPDNEASMRADHTFSYNIDHCLAWARSEFDGLFEKIPTEVNASLTDPSKYISTMKIADDAHDRDTLNRVLECLDKDRCDTFQDCITWARLRFADYFANDIRQLICTFPEYATTSTGARFWFPPKHFPHSLPFSTDDLSHLHFVKTTAILRAETFGIPIPDWVKSFENLADAVDKVNVPAFLPCKDVKIVTDEKATSLSTTSPYGIAIINELIMKLEVSRKKLPSGFILKSIQFEKDANYHMDLIAGLANLRPQNFSIPEVDRPKAKFIAGRIIPAIATTEVDRLKAKFIAGRIIPSIATTTAMATGLVCLELYKVLDGHHKVEDYRNTFTNLALSLFLMAEPVPPKFIKHQDMSWTVWDMQYLKENTTLRDLLKWCQNKGIKAYCICLADCLIYGSLFPRNEDRMDRKLMDVVKEMANVELSLHRCFFEVMVRMEDIEDHDVHIPQITDLDPSRIWIWNLHNPPPPGKVIRLPIHPSALWGPRVVRRSGV